VALYDGIGRTYATTRRPDPRLAERIVAAVGQGTVVNVGAGTGSYEPPGTVLAVEPSATMIAQRPPGAAPAIQASGDALPLDDGAFDVALAVLTIHHWPDLARGLAELRRVARRHVVLTWDAEVGAGFWLLRDYLPEAAAWDSTRFPPVAEVAAVLDARIEVVPVPHDCTDGFLGAFWRRPHAYLDPAVQAGISLFAQRPELSAQGLARLEGDLASGAWAERNAGLLALDELDVGYRLLVSA
jgi:SAM-dependent methyltransferase